MNHLSFARSSGAAVLALAGIQISIYACQPSVEGAEATQSDAATADVAQANLDDAGEPLGDAGTLDGDAQANLLDASVANCQSPPSGAPGTLHQVMFSQGGGSLSTLFDFDVTCDNIFATTIGGSLVKCPFDGCASPSTVIANLPDPTASQGGFNDHPHRIAAFGGKLYIARPGTFSWPAGSPQPLPLRVFSFHEDGTAGATLAEFGPADGATEGAPMSITLEDRLVRHATGVFFATRTAAYHVCDVRLMRQNTAGVAEYARFSGTEASWAVTPDRLLLQGGPACGGPPAPGFASMWTYGPSAPATSTSIGFVVARHWFANADGAGYSAPTLPLSFKACSVGTICNATGQPFDVPIRTPSEGSFAQDATHLYWIDSATGDLLKCRLTDIFAGTCAPSILVPQLTATTFGLNVVLGSTKRVLVEGPYVYVLWALPSAERRIVRVVK